MSAPKTPRGTIHGHDGRIVQRPDCAPTFTESDSPLAMYIEGLNDDEYSSQELDFEADEDVEYWDEVLG